MKDANTSEAVAPATNSATSSQEGFSETVASADSIVAEAITSLGSDLSTAIEQLSTILPTSSNSITLTQVCFAIFVAFVGALSAYLFNYFHWKMVENKQKISRLGAALSSLISDLESIAVDYWIQDYREEDQQNTHAIEISIKSKIRLISRYIGIIIPKLNSKTASRNIQKLEDFSLDIFDLVTGDGFESKTKIASKQKALQISNRCSDIRAMISSLDV